MTPPATASVSLREAFMAGLRGKTLGYAYATAAIRAYCRGISGRVLDIAGGKNPEYTRSFKHVELVRTNLNASEGVVAVDMNKPLPFPDNSFDAALLFAALYIAEHPTDLAREVKRILKAGERGTSHRHSLAMKCRSPTTICASPPRDWSDCYERPDLRR